MPDHSIKVVDTRQLSIGQGFLVLEAAKWVREGTSTSEVIEKVLAVGERVHLYAALSTLKYLAMSGRVGHLAAGMANLLSVRPILSVQEGKLDLLEKIRTTKKSWARVIELVGQHLDGKTPERMAIVHVTADDHLPEFEQLLRESLSCPNEILVAELTPGLSVHSGAGMLGVCVVAPQ
jgi:DegV family protein with EDD domain